MSTYENTHAHAHTAELRALFDRKSNILQESLGSRVAGCREEEWGMDGHQEPEK